MLGRVLALLTLLFPVIASVEARPSEEVPARTLNDIVYSRAGGADLLMDASLPAGSTPAPAVIIVHGGGWVRGDRRIDVRPLFKPLSDAGFAWFSISYRLASNIKEFGSAIDDVEAAAGYIKAHANEYNIDPDRIALIGESAGGQLAAMAALRGGAASSVKAVVAFYTPTDLVSLLKNSEYIPSQIRDQVIGTPWEWLVIAGLSRLSPIENVRHDMPPFLLIHGTSDHLVPFDQSEQMCKKMRQARASCEVYPIDGAGHGIRWWSQSELRSADKKMVIWLERELKSTPA